MSETYFHPGNIFLARDFRRVIHPEYGEITIDIDGAFGWRAYITETRGILTENNNVWGMCAWLNANHCDASQERSS